MFVLLCTVRLPLAVSIRSRDLLWTGPNQPKLEPNLPPSSFRCCGLLLPSGRTPAAERRTTVGFRISPHARRQCLRNAIFKKIDGLSSGRDAKFSGPLDPTSCCCCNSSYCSCIRMDIVVVREAEPTVGYSGLSLLFPGAEILVWRQRGSSPGYRMFLRTDGLSVEDFLLSCDAMIWQ